MKDQFPFINHATLRRIVYSVPRTEKVTIGHVTFDRHTYVHNPQLVLDALARDAEALKVVGHLRKLINRKRAQYYPYFNRSLTKREIQELENQKRGVAL